MTPRLRDIERLLSKDELELVTETKQPGLGQLSDEDLSSLSKRLRDARDRAQTIAQRQRREMRGKATRSGARAASDNSGSAEKTALLASAMQRVNKEGSRRKDQQGRSELVRNAQKALKTKEATPDPAAGRPTSRTANEGMQLRANNDAAPSGAFEKEGQRPVLERSRKVR
jgi:hypothetical protein